MLRDNSIPRGLREGWKHKDLNQIRSRSHLYSVVKLVSQGQGTITADTAHAILGRRLLTSRYAYHSNPLPVH